MGVSGLHGNGHKVKLPIGKIMQTWFQVAFVMVRKEGSREEGSIIFVRLGSSNKVVGFSVLCQTPLRLRFFFPSSVLVSWTASCSL